MAVLPTPDEVGPIPDSPGRRTPIAGWNPRIIEQAGREAGAGFERLGADISNLGIEDQQRQNALQMAQARGDAAAAVTNTLATLPSVTDSSKLPAMQDAVAGAVNAAGARLNPYQKNLFDAEHEGILAQANAHITARGREIDNQNAVANFETGSQDTISKAASLETYAAGVAALDPINKQIGDLVTAGALTPEQGVAYKKRAAEQLVTARRDNLLARAQGSGNPADWQKYNEFLGIHSDVAGQRAGTPGGDSLSLIRGREGFQGSAYWDVNHWRVGYGSDTVTRADGSVESVTKNTTVTQADAERDLARRARQTQTGIAMEVGPSRWDSLGPGAQAALTSMAYNYGHLPFDVAAAVRGGSAQDIARMIEGHAGDNKGVNRERRMQEASIVLGAPIPADSGGLGYPALTGGKAQPAAFPVARGSGAPPIEGLTPISYGGPGAAGLPMPGAGVPMDVPPQSEWPDGAENVVQNGDGSASYQMRDGSFVPIPGSATPLGGGVGLSPIPKDSLLNALPPDRAAEMRLQGVRENLQYQRQRAMMMRRDIRGDLGSIDNMVKAMTTGTIPDPAAIARSDAVFNAPGVDPNVQGAWAQAKQIAEMLRPLQGQPPAQVTAIAADWRNKVEDLRKQDPFNPALPYLDAVAKNGELFASNYAQGLRKNAYAVAARDNVISYTPVNPADPQTVAKRVEDNAAINQHYGITAPMLTPEDKIALRGMARQGGQPFFDAVKGIVAGGGVHAGQFFKEIGGDAPDFLTAGQLMLDPNVDHSETIDRLTQWIADNNDKTKAKNLIHVGRGAIGKAGIIEPTGAALAGMGNDYQARITAAGRDLVSDEMTQHNSDPAIDPKFFQDNGQAIIDRNYNLAVGGHQDENNNWFGGFHTALGGSWWTGRSGPADSYQVLVPSDMRADKWDDVIGHLTDADIAKAPTQPYSIGRNEPINANTIKNGQFVAVPNKRTGAFDGMYKVLLPQGNDMVPVVDKQGRPWVLDLSGLAKDPTFRGRVPDAFMPLVGAPVQPRYKPTPGLVEPDLEAANQPAGES